MVTIKEQLQNGEIIEFQGEGHILYIYYKKVYGGGREYIINFNCKVIEMRKTYKSIEKKLIGLCRKYDLAQVVEEGVETEVLVIPPVNQYSC